MAEIAHFYAENNTLNTDTTSGPAGGFPVCVITGSSLSANTKYLLIARVLFGGDSTTNKIKVYINSTDDATLETKSVSVYEIEQTGSTSLKSWFFVHSFTTDASPNDIDLRVARQDALGSGYSDQGSLLLIDLDAIGTEGTDYFEDINAATGTEYSTTTDGTTLATLAAADLGTTEEWLILGSANTGIGSTGRNFTVRLNGANDAASSSALNVISEEGEDTAEVRMSGLVGRHKAVTSNVAATITADEEAANGNMTDQGSYLIALPGSFFADFNHDYTAGTQAITAEATVASVGSYTPTTSGNHLIIGMTGSSVGTANGVEVQLHLEDGTTETRTGDSTPTHDQGWDATKDAESAYTMERISISTAKTYNLRATGGTWTAENRWLLVLNLNAGVGPTYPPFPRRQRTTVRM